MNIHNDNPVVGSIVAEAITRFCQREGIVMPKNGDEDVTAWQIAEHFMDYLYKSSDTLDIDPLKGLYLKCESADAVTKTARFAIMWQTDVEMFGHRTDIYTKLGTYGPISIPKWEAVERVAWATDTIMAGNENTPSWWDLLVNRMNFPDYV